MSIKDSHSRRVSFDTKEELGDKIGKLAVMIGILATRDSRSVRQFKSQIYQDKGRGKIEIIMTDAVIINEVIRIDIGQTVEIEDMIEVGLFMSKIIGELILEVMRGILIDKIAEESIEVITEMKFMTETEMGTGLEKGTFLEAKLIEVEIQVIVGLGQD